MGTLKGSRTSHTHPGRPCRVKLRAEVQVAHLLIKDTALNTATSGIKVFQKRPGEIAHLAKCLTRKHEELGSILRTPAYFYFFIYFRNKQHQQQQNHIGAREVTQWLSTLAALPEDLGHTHTHTHMAACSQLSVTMSGRYEALFWPLLALHVGHKQKQNH